MAFHAGGATNYHLLDPYSQGLAIIRDIWSRWSELDITQIGSLVAIAGILPHAWRFSRRVWHEVRSWVKQCFIVSVTIPGGDPLNKSVVKWILDNQPRHCQSFSGRTNARATSMDRGGALKKTKHPVQFLPHWRTRWFWHDGNVLITSRAADDYSSSASDPGYDGVGWEELTVSCFGWSLRPVQSFIDTCREYADHQAQFFVIIYSRGRHGLSWKPRTRRPIRHLDTVHFDNELKDQLITDIRNYLDPKTQKRYLHRSMPYRRGYLFYGPPGTGKSSLSVAIAGEFGLDLYEVTVPSVATDGDLEQMFEEIPPRCVVLLEDIDAVWTEREDKSKEGKQQGVTSNCTLSGLLNVIDGVGSQEGRIIIMTTNRPEQLDSALIRPGRVDMKVFLGNISQKSAQEMFMRIFSPDLGCKASWQEVEELALRFASKIPKDTFTPSMLQGFFQLHLDDPYVAEQSIDGWVGRELGKSFATEFEMIDEGKGS